MPSSRLHGFLFITLALTVFPVYAGAQSSQANQENSITIPGGFSPVARLIGMSDSSPDTPPDLQHLFKFLLESEPPFGTAHIRYDLISYLKQFNQFLQYLQIKRMVPSNLPGQYAREIRFPLKGDKIELENTRKLLSFFGIDCRIRDGNRDAAAILEIKETRLNHAHDTLYKALGFCFTDQGLREIRISLEPGRIPLLLGQLKWKGILSSENPDLLFQRFVENPNAMRLYLALAACSQTARESLPDSVQSPQLLKSSEVLLFFGSDLKFENGKLIFPGSLQAWAALPGSPAFSPKALLSGGGAGLLLYSSLSAAPPAVQNYLTSSTERLKSYLEILKKYASGVALGPFTAAAGQDLTRILRVSTIGSEGLILDLNGSISSRLLSWIGCDQSELSPAGHVLLTPNILAKLLPSLRKSPYAEPSRTDILEFLHYLGKAQPGSLSASSIDLLMKNPEQAPVFLDLIGDLEPDPALLSQYLQYCTKLAAAGVRGWNLSRTRTSQSIFFLMAALRGENAISRQEANTLLQDALNAFSPDDQGQFAFNTAEFISTELMNRFSALYRSSPDPILSALSGSQTPHRITCDGKELAIDLGARKYARMQETIRSQSVTPIATLLDIFAMLRNIEAAVDPADMDREMRLLFERLNDVRTSEPTPGELMLKRKNPAAKTEVDTLKRRIASSGSWAITPVLPATQAREIAAQIHTELGVTLLAYCYAYSAMPDLTVLAFDPNFVRKHRFYHPELAGKPSWSRSHFVQDEEVGGLIEGSLAGIGYQLTRLQIAQLNDDFGVSSNIDIAPSILSGIRQVRPELRSDRSQAYVALATGLGQSMISLPETTDPLENLIDAVLASLLSPQRLEEISRGRSHPGSASAAAVLSRSELFLLGQAYFNSPELNSGRYSEAALRPFIDKLNAIVPKPGSVEYNDFQNEVSQYGILLRSRIGLSRFSFNMIDSYERLGKSLHPQYLYDRICDLKIRLAELNYSLGLPASLGEIEADLALSAILPCSSQTDAGDWKSTIDKINGLAEKTVLGWIDNLMPDGSLRTEFKATGTHGL